MPRNPISRTAKPASAEDRSRHAEIRKKVMQEFPPVATGGDARSPEGLSERIRSARVAKGLTWYAVANLAGVPNSNTLRDIEAGRDAQLSSVIAVAKALGLRVELVEPAG